MVSFYVRGQERRSCETRLAEDDHGYELVLNDAAGSHIERFLTLRKLLAREHELFAAWRAQGWRPVGDASRKPKPERATPASLPTRR
jgi:hypothetical protein